MAQATPLVSVILPIYNVQKYLAECLDSVLAQTYENLEILCVNDGSTDSSLQIMRSYEEKDSRVRVIDKPNGGYGHAVNRGLSEAKGDWLAIVEPDDIIAPTMYEDLLALVADRDGDPVDVIKGSYWLYFDLEDTEGAYVRRPNLMNCMPQYCCDLDVWKDPEVMRHHPSIWSAIYRRAFIEDCGIRMIEPKGAGWADNPWFFETMLQAKTVVWTPAPYYFYRQTNPEASSKLKTYDVPFDRLRDIRAIYKRFDIGRNNEGLLLALYQRSFNYIMDSILDEFEFPENDELLQANIREVFETFDADLILNTKKLAKKQKDYYKDFMGLTLKGISSHGAVSNPKISFVIPMYNDRKALWGTLKSLLMQDYENWEAILVDCQSPDRSLEIAKGLAGKDKRFRVYDGCANVAEGYNKGLENSKGAYVRFMRPGVVLDLKNALSLTVANMKGLSQDVDTVVLRNHFGASRIVRRDNDDLTCLELDTAGLECDVAMASFPMVYTRMYRRRFLEEQSVRFHDANDTDGIGFCAEAAIVGKRAALVKSRDVLIDTREELDRATIHDEEQLIDFVHTRYEAVAEVAQRIDTEAAWRVARACIIQRMAVDVAMIGRVRSGKVFFDSIEEAFTTKYGIASAPVTDYCNYLDYCVLEEAFTYGYEAYQAMLMGSQSLSIVGLHTRNRNLAVKVDKIKTSGSYLMGKRIGDVAKNAVPKQAIKSIVKKLR